MTKTWIISGYKGFDDCDGKSDYNIGFELEMDSSVTKEEIESLLVSRYKRYRCLELNVKIKGE